MPKTVCTASARWVPGRIRAILHQKSIQALLVGDVYGSQLQTSPVLFFRLTMCIIMTCLSEEALFIPGIFFFGGGDFPAQKNLLPSTATRLCALNLFGRDSGLQIYHGNFLLMDNTHEIIRN